LFTYASGSTTKQSTYTTAALSVANTNPIVLDSAGRASIFVAPGTSFKFVLAPANDTDPPVSPIWTVDNVTSIPLNTANTDIDGTAGENILAGEVVYLSAGDGGRTAGSWYKADADLAYGSTTANALGFAVTAINNTTNGTIRQTGRVTGLSALTPGTLYYVSATAGALTSSAPANARAIAVADSTTSVVIIAAVPEATATSPGIVSTGTQSFAGVKTFNSGITVAVGATFANLTMNAPIVGAVGYGRSTSDFTKNNNTTLADVTGIALTVAANETWIYMAVLHGTSPTAADFKLAITFPTAATAVRYGIVSGPGNTFTESTGTAAGAIVYESGNVEETILLAGILRNGANAGSIQVQMAQQAATVGDTIIRADSYIFGMRIV
jgi:hypothetical protein